MTTSPAKTEAARLLAQSVSQSSVARQVGMNRATIHRWLKEPEFIALIDQFRAEIVAESQTLESLVPKAFNTLESLLNGDSGVSASTARVALDVLKAAAQVRNASEQGETSFEQRLRELDLGN